MEAPGGAVASAAEVGAESGAGGRPGRPGEGWTLQPFAGTSAERAVVWRRVPRKLLPGVPALPWRPLWQTAAGPQNYTAGGTFRHFDGRLMRVLNVTRSADDDGAGGAVVLPSLGGGWVLQDAGLLHGQGPDPDPDDPDYTPPAPPPPPAEAEAQAQPAEPAQATEDQPAPLQGGTGGSADSEAEGAAPGVEGAVVEGAGAEGAGVEGAGAGGAEPAAEDPPAEGAAAR